MTNCPNCGAELPQEEGQHALSPSAGTVAEGEPVSTEASLEATERHDYFSGEETVGGVMDELRDKPGGPDGGEP
jgi:hypothetical protein